MDVFRDPSLLVWGLRPTPMVLLLWSYTAFYWAKPYVNRALRRIVYLMVQLVALGLLICYLWAFIARQLTLAWPIISNYVQLDTISISASQFLFAFQKVFLGSFVVSFAAGSLLVGAFWFATRLYGGLAGKPSATVNGSTTVNSATLNDLTALISAALQPYKSQQFGPSPSSHLDIPTLTQQIITQLQPLVVETIRQSLASMPALSSLVTSVPSANFVANLVEGLQVEIESLQDSLDHVHSMIANLDKEAADNASLPGIPKPIDKPLASQAQSLTGVPPESKDNKYVRWADIVSSDEEASTVNSMVAMTSKAPQKVKRLPHTTPPQLVSRKALPDELPEDFAKLTESELLEKLKERQAQRQAAKRPPYYLTDDEKQLSMDALHRLWKVERQRQNNEKEALSRHDFEELGQLTADQKELPRAAIRRLIRQRKNEVWANAMKARGIPVFQCDVCYELTTGNHRCMATKWTTDNSKNSAISKGIVMTQGPGGIRLQTKAIIDQEKLNREFEYLQSLRNELEAKAKLAQPLEPIAQDISMCPDTVVPLATGDPPRV
jgi:hypothetical protein